MQKKWENIIKDLDKGKTFDEATKNVPLAVKLIKKRFSQVHISTGQHKAVRRG